MTPKMLLFGLMIQCPFGEGNSLADCPLNEYRSSLSLEEKYMFTSDLDPTFVEKILIDHGDCYQKRNSKLKRSMRTNDLNCSHKPLPNLFLNQAVNTNL